MESQPPQYGLLYCSFYSNLLPVAYFAKLSYEGLLVARGVHSMLSMT